MRRSAVVLAALAALLARPAAAQQAGAGATDSGTTAAHRDSVAAVLTPRTGDYNCVRTVWAGHAGGSFRFESQGYLTLRSDGSYAFDRSNRVGTYAVAPATRSITWTGGYFGDKGRLTSTFGIDGAPTVEVIFHERAGDTRWVCAMTPARAPASGSTSATPAATARPPR